MLTTIAYSAILPLEMGGLFALWNWSRRQRSPLWLLGGLGLLTSLLLALALLPPLPARMYLGYAGMYVFSGLMWAWWIDGLVPADWKPSEFGVAVIAVAFFAIANSCG